jgi:N-methylhydantoinase A/oxoprolinase/acetone carboxylase beta subunit
VAAVDVVAVVDAAMAEAVRVVTVSQGVDPAGLALVAFGGAGPLHACAIADALGIQAVIVPARAGVLSAAGLLTAPEQRDLVRSWPTPWDHAGVEVALRALGREAVRELHARRASGTEVGLAVDARYRGQSHELTVGCPEGSFDLDAFHALHARRNGYRREGDPVEVIALRASASVPSPVTLGGLGLPPTPRRDAVGPVANSEPDCSIWVAEGWQATVGVDGAYVMRRVPA